MKHYQKVEDAIEGVIDKLLARGIEVKAGTWQGTDAYKDEEMLVLRNEFFSFPVDLCIMCLKKTGADIPWVEEHFKERISGIPSNPGESYKIWPYNDFKDGEDPYMDGKKFSHTYQERFWPKKANANDHNFGLPMIYNEPYKPSGEYSPRKGIRYPYGDLKDVIKQIKKNPLDRQIYLPIWFPEDTGAVHGERVPCTLGYYFWIEDNNLHCNYMIRSCDAFRHFRNDVYLTIRLMQFIAVHTKLDLGNLNFLCFNFHVFKNNIYGLKKKEEKIRNSK